RRLGRRFRAVQSPGPWGLRDLSRLLGKVSVLRPVQPHLRRVARGQVQGRVPLDRRVPRFSDPHQRSAEGRGLSSAAEWRAPDPRSQGGATREAREGGAVGAPRAARANRAARLPVSKVLKEKKNMKGFRSLTAVGLSMMLLACGGSAGGGKGAVSPEDDSGRKSSGQAVSKEAAASFDQAIASFQANDKGGKWNDAACKSTADQFMKASN